MATITSTKSGLASDPTVWSGGVVPVEGDKVIIAAGHVVTLDGAFTWGDDSVTETLPNAAVNVYGTLKASRAVDCSLTGKGLILLGLGDSTVLDFGTDADPLPAARKATLILNKAATPAVRYGLRQINSPTTAGNGATISMVSANARLHTLPLQSTAAAGAASVVVTSADHGWEVGDTLMFVTTTDSTTQNQCEFRAILAISGAALTLDSPLTYTHLQGSPAANMTRNIVVRSFNEVQGQVGRVYISAPNSAKSNFYFNFGGVEFRNTGGDNSNIIENQSNPTLSGVFVSFDRCSLHNRVSTSARAFAAIWTQFPTFTRTCFYTPGGFNSGGANPCTISDCVIVGSLVGGVKTQVYDTWVTGVLGAGLVNPGVGTILKNVTTSGTSTALFGSATVATVAENCDFGFTYGYQPFFGQNGLIDISRQGYEQVVLKDCLANPKLLTPDVSINTTLPGKSEFISVQYLNKQRDTSAQEIWAGSGVTYRENSLVFRGTSALRIATWSTVRPTKREQQILCAAGQTIRVVGNVRMDAAFWNAGDCNLPTVSLTGLGATPVTFTASAAANNAWEFYDLTITNTSGADGNFTLTYTASAKTVTTGNVYFDGVPDAPFITKVRHYGFLFNETSPTREVNPYTVATEAVAAAYTGVTINATTKRVSFGAGTADTFAEVYDYSQAWGCLNIDKDMPWSRAGALLSLTSGWTVVDPTLAGVTWGGGTVEFSAPGTVTQSFDTAQIKFTAAGTYNLAGSAFAGTVEFVNTSGGAVTVQVPAGASYTNTGPNITVELPTSDVDIVAAALIAGSRVRLYNVTDATEIYNAVLPSTGLVHTLTYSADKVVVLRADHATKLPLEVAGVLTASGLTFLDVQQEDVVYVGNAIDGTTVSEFTADEPNVEVDIDDLDGSTSFRRLYAWMQHYFTTEAGIRSSMFGAVTAIDSGTYVINTAKADILLDNVGVLPVAFMNGDRLIRSDGTSVIAPTSGTIHIDSGFVPVVETGVSGLTATESERLLALDTTYLDAPVSSRLAAASYTAPDNAGIADIDAKTDALATLVADVVDGVEASTVLAKEATAAKAVQNAALAVALGA